jgi:hypothetical protein
MGPAFVHLFASQTNERHSSGLAHASPPFFEAVHLAEAMSQ